MTNSQRLATIRAAIENWLSSNLADEPEPVQSSIQSESILIRGEFYCGRRFNTATHRAVWFIEEDQLKIYRKSGDIWTVLCHTQIDDEAAPATLPMRLDSETGDAYETGDSVDIEIGTDAGQQQDSEQHSSTRRAA